MTTTFAQKMTDETLAELSGLLFGIAEKQYRGEDAGADVERARGIAAAHGIDDDDLDASLGAYRSGLAFRAVLDREIPPVVDHAEERTRLAAEAVELERRLLATQNRLLCLVSAEKASKRDRAEAVRAKRDRVADLRRRFKVRPFPSAGEIADAERELASIASALDETHRKLDARNWRRDGRRAPDQPGEKDHYADVPTRRLLEMRVDELAADLADHVELHKYPTGPDATRRRRSLDAAENLLAEFDALHDDLTAMQSRRSRTEARLSGLRSQAKAWADDPRNVALPID
jgi:hypothetical protein